MSHRAPDSAGSVSAHASALVRALAASSTYAGHPNVTVHETHASWVFVAGKRAYKVKKPVALGFLDYSTLALRRSACEEEVRVNQILAPGLYIGVRAIVRVGSGFALAGSEARDAVEYAVAMRAFGAEDTLSARIAAGAPIRTYVRATAKLLADFHRSAPIVSGWGPKHVLAKWRRNLAELGGTPHPDEWQLDVLADFGAAFVGDYAAELRRRSRDGLTRDGHGDLRCEHVLIRPRLRVVDRIEFDPHLRRTDAACDVAFLAMDLEARGERREAEMLLDSYEHAGMNAGDDRLRAFYATHWALVRAKVELITASERCAADGEHYDDARRLWSLAALLRWRARGSLLLVICGPAATGKSQLAADLSREGEIPIVASDSVRKSLAGVAARERARPEHYSDKFTRATYTQLGLEAMRRARDSGSVIVDATCHSRAERAVLLAQLPQIRRLFIRCDAPLALALERAARRLRDPARVSDATPAVVEAQFRAFEELDELPACEVARIDTTQPREQQVAAVERALDRR